ncbi:hypothetical protein [Rhodoplanes sp. Z2-YC6860]|uniref:hypothetical protein n=1 Tax=Rhodoplanes sp. Z2-YC6860 TaxID=674703 RepID=UPI001F19D8C8|nr:hypothetical protein [Rhodoplanes sp. Z2-YC6860]
MALLSAAMPVSAQQQYDQIAAVSPAVEAYIRARTAYEQEAEAYWQSTIDKRRLRFAKRRSGTAIVLDDYVLTQPPVYSGPPRPSDYVPPQRDPQKPPVPIPTIPEFLKVAAERFNFAPDRPRTEGDFKLAYAKVAAAAGLTREQAVRIYAFETGGNGGYDSQAGLISTRKDARPISPAIGYNQLLSTNTVSLFAEHGDKFISALTLQASRLTGAERSAMNRKIAALRNMVAFTRTVPNSWSEHDKLAKFTDGGKGTHAAILDRDIGPLLQTQKLLDSVMFARAKGLQRPLTAAELELMNFTGDGNGFDMVTMPLEFRPQVPTSNFFQRGGYERNPIARRTGNVAALFEAIDRKMDSASQSAGAKELAQAF